MLEELRRHREMVQERIQKSFENGLNFNILIKGKENEFEKTQENEYTDYSVNDLIKAGVLEYDDTIEKAVYADTPQNRKLGRVGQEYHRGKGKKVEEKTGEKSVNDNNKTPEKKQQNIADKNLFGGVLDEVRKKRQGWILSRDWKKTLGKYDEDKLNSFIESHTEKLKNIQKRAKDILNSKDRYPWGGKVKSDEEKQQLVHEELKNIVDQEDLIGYAKNLLSNKKVNENAENNTKNESKQETKNGKMNFETAVNFLEENADYWSAYQYDSLDEDDEKEREIKEKFDSAKKFISKFKTFQIHSEKQEEKAKQYKKDMESEGFKLVDLGQGSGIVHYAILKNK